MTKCLPIKFLLWDIFSRRFVELYGLLTFLWLRKTAFCPGASCATFVLLVLYDSHLSKRPSISTSITKCKRYLCTILMASAIACSVLLFGLNPWLLSWNFASQIGFRTCKIHCCTILSQIEGIPNDLVFPPGFEISTRFTAFGLCHSSLLRTFFTNSLSEILSKFSMFNLTTPAVLLPSSPLMFLYADFIFSSDRNYFYQIVKGFSVFALRIQLIASFLDVIVFGVY